MYRGYHQYDQRLDRKGFVDDSGSFLGSLKDIVIIPSFSRLAGETIYSVHYFSKFLGVRLYVIFTA